jgi:integrase
MFLSKNSNGRYYIYYDKPDGKRTSISTKTKLKSEALKFLTNFENEQKQRAQEKVTAISLKKLLFEYLKYSETIHSRNTTLSIKSTVNSLNGYFGETNFASIDRNKISQYLHFRMKASTPYVSKREKAYLSGIYNWAINNGYARENNCKGIKNYKLPEKQPLFFNIEEFQKLLVSIESNDLKDLVLFAVNTGLRQMELLTLQWSQIDFKNRFLILDNRLHLTKSKKVRTIPLNITVSGAISIPQVKWH